MKSSGVKDSKVSVLSSSVDWVRLAADRDAIESKLNGLEFTDKGLRRICFHEKGEPGLQVMLIESLPNCSFPNHYHTHDESIIVLRGSLRIIFQDMDRGRAEVALDANNFCGNFYLIPTGAIHATFAGPSGCIYMEIKYLKGLCEPATIFGDHNG